MYPCGSKDQRDLILNNWMLINYRFCKRQWIGNIILSALKQTQRRTQKKTQFKI